jgi:quercetin dioxygenase-like cupin family protein
MKIRNYFLNDDIKLEYADKGVERKVLAYNKNLMCVEVHFEKGAVGAVHTHPHEQITYVLSGKFEFNVDGEKVLLQKGDSAYKQPNIPHGAVCIEKGVLLDIFTPCRKDFLGED